MKAAGKIGQLTFLFFLKKIRSFTDSYSLVILYEDTTYNFAHKLHTMQCLVNHYVKILGWDEVMHQKR